jgi:hypothetical protein
VVVVYGGTADDNTGIATPTGNSITFNLEKSITISDGGSQSGAYIWTGTDSAGGTNWTLSAARSGSNDHWGMTCLVFRASDGVGNSNKNFTTTSGAPSVSLTTASDNSAIVAFNADWLTGDGTTRTWRTINSITPTAGNNLERTYVFDNPQFTLYGAYWNDAGTAGAKTVGMTTPSGQKFSIVTVEIKGHTAAAPAVTASVSWLKA